MYRSSGFPNRPSRAESMSSSSHHQFSDGEAEIDMDGKSLLYSEQTPEINLWERLGKAAVFDIESSDISWNMLSSLHHTEHTSIAEQSEDEMNRALEVTVNSGGVVFFALFNIPENDNSSPKEAAAVIKISSSRMATQSERLGYEFAKWLGIRTPQAKVVHNSSLEWQQIKDAAEKSKKAAVSLGDEVGEITCSELLEALELSRCILLMNYVHGSPLLESSDAFDSREAAGKTAAALGRVLMLDLILRNEDRLPCRHLGWRGNYGNLLFSDNLASTNMDALKEASNSPISIYRPRITRTILKERRAISVDSRLSPRKPRLVSQKSETLDMRGFPEVTPTARETQALDEFNFGDVHVVAIDSGVPRRPPAGKRANDHAQYPKVVELLLHNAEFACNLLYEITAGKMGLPESEEVAWQTDQILSDSDIDEVVKEFRGGFRMALRELQSFHLFLVTLYQKLDGLLRVFLSIFNKSSGDFDKEDIGPSDSPLQAGHGASHACKDSVAAEAHTDLSDSERTASRLSSPGYKEGSDSSSPSPSSRENYPGRYFKGSPGLRLTMKLRDFNRYAKVDAELNREMEQWNEMLRADVVKLCQENNFNTGFFEGNDTNMVVDAYELKVRLDHILERVGLITDAANTERPSMVTDNLYIGGALAARAVHTLQRLGITHILCLCSNEIGQSDSQFPDLFKYKNFSIYDNDDAEISTIFEETSNYIEHVEHLDGKVLVHCFEGKSRSATVVLAYLMLRKSMTLQGAWNMLKKAHRRAQPNDGFAKTLLDLDKRLHGRVSMEWQQKRPVMKVCPICGKNAGLSSSSLKLHLQKSHRKFSSGSVDSAMTSEIQKVLEVLNINRGDSINPNTQKQSHH
ncbi:Dual specificity protein phosphatase PHS1 [Acorus calamus]|uniref:Dual specificity protein phosphatase PHS1 n=1 Tax=Acorus calamus TaxID=4465 RepID=A0AAV9CTY7_ACOCL|nr:Dual specificity protein phosphatase PHS1 [Acorus calamus]